MKYIYELRENMQMHDLLLVYEGQFSQDITKSVLSMAERNMDANGENIQIKRKVFNVMVECLQNIVKHNRDSADPSAIFVIGKDDKQYSIATGNLISMDAQPKIKAKIEKINSLDKDGLKALYKDLIKGNKISEKGGAGLGFVDMAKKSGNKLNYEFIPVSDDQFFFILKAIINKDK